MRRRELLRGGLTSGALLLARRRVASAASEARTRVVVVKTGDHADGVRRALRLLGADGLAGKHVVVKPNFNSADPFPGSTHPETLDALVEWLGAAGASRVTVADRSGMGQTREVMDAKGIFTHARKRGFAPVVLDDLPAHDWVSHRLPGSHWRRGVLFPRLLA